MPIVKSRGLREIDEDASYSHQEGRVFLECIANFFFLFTKVAADRVRILPTQLFTANLLLTSLYNAECRKRYE